MRCAAMEPELDEAVQHVFHRANLLANLRHSQLLIPEIITQRDTYALMILDVEKAKFQDEVAILQEAVAEDGRR